MRREEFWYPVCLSEELQAGQVVGRKLLGRPLVLYRDVSGAAAGFLDRCAHRGAPLSRGKVKEGHLECPYHGWRYDAGGACTRVPGSDDQERACRGKRLQPFAVREQDGLVFVFGDPEVEPRGEPYRHPRFVDPGYSSMLRTFRTRGTLEVVLDNFMDTQHPPFLHPGMIYDDDSRSRVDVTVKRWESEEQPGQVGVVAVYEGEPSPTRGWIGRVLTGSAEEHPTFHHERFIAPSFHQNEYKVGPDAHLYVTCYNTPEDESHVRIHMLAVFRFRLPVFATRFLLDRFLLTPTVRQDVDFFAIHHEHMELFGGEEVYQSTEHDTHGLRVRAFLDALDRVDDPTEIEVPETRYVGWM